MGTLVKRLANAFTRYPRVLTQSNLESFISHSTLSKVIAKTLFLCGEMASVKDTDDKSQVIALRITLILIDRKGKHLSFSQCHFIAFYRQK